MKKLNRRFFTLIFCTALITISATAQKGTPQKRIYLEAKPVTTKTNLSTTDTTRNKSTYSFCKVYFDNYTSYPIDLWVEGIYQGRIEPNTISVRFDIYTIEKSSKWYAQTTDGALFWSNSFYCSDFKTITLTTRKLR